MGPQQRNQINVERPSYYHLPRSRPVSFEKPSQLSAPGSGMRASTISEASSFLRSNLAHYVNNQQHSKQQQFESNQNQTSKMNSNSNSCEQGLSLGQFTSHNNVPKPFVIQGDSRSTSGLAGNENGHQMLAGHSSGSGQLQANLADPVPRQPTPRILVTSECSHYPTSTVHKSMLGSRSSSKNENTSYSRLVTPSLMTASYESVSSQSLGASNNSLEIATTNADSIQGDCADQQRTQSAESSQKFKIDNRGQSSSSSLKAPEKPTTPPSNSEFGERKDLSETSTDSQWILPKSKSPVALSSNTVLPDTKRDEFMFSRQLERASIAHQTYRTLPIVMPKPKARHDLASGTYMRYTQDPTWDLAQAKPMGLCKDHSRKIQQAIRGTVSYQSIFMLLNPLNSLTNQPLILFKSLDPRSVSRDDSVPAFNYREYIESTRRAF